MTAKTDLTKESILNLIASSDIAVGRALVALYARQTATEQYTQSTDQRNGRGFNSVDAEILSSFAEQYRRRGTLSQKQLALARKKLAKYAGQLLQIAEEKAASAAAQNEAQAAMQKIQAGMDQERTDLDWLRRGLANALA